MDLALGMGPPKDYIIHVMIPSAFLVYVVVFAISISLGFALLTRSFSVQKKKKKNKEQWKVDK